MTLRWNLKGALAAAMLLLCPTPAALAAGKGHVRVPVLLVAGQSNTDGRVPNSDMPDYLKSYGETHGGHYPYTQWCYGSAGRIQTGDSLSGSPFAPY